MVSSLFLRAADSVRVVKNDGDSCVAEEVIAKIDTEGVAALSPLEVKPVPTAAAAPSPAPAAPAAAPSGKVSGVAMPAAVIEP